MSLEHIDLLASCKDILFGDRYQPLSYTPLAKQASSLVVEARDTHEDSRTVILKIKPEFDKQELGPVERLEQEAEFMRHLSGRGFPQLYGCGKQYVDALERHVMWIAMEHLGDSTLSSYMDEQREFNKVAGVPGCLTDRQAYQILHETLEALEALHIDFGVVHRLIHPTHIMLDGWMRPSLINFSLVRSIERGGIWDPTNHVGHCDEYGVIRCIPRYAPPEVLGFYPKKNRDPIHRPAVDIWSLGVVAYEMIVGEHPFDHLYSDMDLCEFIVNGPDPIVLPPAHQNSLLAPWIERALQRKPYMRFGDAEEALLRLEELELAILRADLERTRGTQEEGLRV